MTTTHGPATRGGVNASQPFSRPALFAISATLIVVWGSAFTLVGLGVDHIDPYWLTAGRLVVGAVFLAAYALLRGHRFPPLRDPRWAWYSVLGLTGAVIPFILMAVGQLTVDSGLTAVIVGAMPLLTIVLAHFFTDEKLTLWKVAGFVIGFCGVAVLFMPDEPGFGLTGDWVAQLIILAAAFCYAFTTVAAKRAPDTPAEVGAAMMIGAAAVAGVVAALVVKPVGFTPNGTAWFAIIVLGFGSTGMATILYLTFIDRAGPSAMARLNYFPPMASVVFGVWLLDEDFTWKIALAFVVIIIGVMISRRGSASPSTPQTGSPGPHPGRGRPRPPVPALRARSSKGGPDRD